MNSWKEFYDWIECMINKKATIFVVDDEDKLPSKIKKIIKRGDIVENNEESGYRTSGVYIWDGKKSISLSTTPDDYGTIPIEFRVISEFPIDYWHTFQSPISQLSKNTSQFDWHNNYVPVSKNILNISDKCKPKTAIFKNKSHHYKIFGFEFFYRNLKFVLLFSLDYEYGKSLTKDQLNFAFFKKQFELQQLQNTNRNHIYLSCVNDENEFFLKAYFEKYNIPKSLALYV
jgi:hypothetical protein